MRTRADLMTEGLPLTGQGLEIGPLNRPIVSKEDRDVVYLDHLDAEGLREKYRNHPRIRAECIVEIDHVLEHGSLSKTLGRSPRFDYIIASHVIEHVPNLVAFLTDTQRLLRANGVLALAVPDKRYCFDYDKPESTTADVLEAHFEDRRRPNFRQVFNHFHKLVRLRGVEAWNPSVSPQRIHSVKRALEFAKTSQLPGQYKDVHCWAFTTHSFKEIFRDLRELEIIQFRLQRLIPTRRNTNEFYVHLAR